MRCDRAGSGCRRTRPDRTDPARAPEALADSTPDAMASTPATSPDAPVDPSGSALVPVTTIASLSERAHAELSQLEAELEEIELLVTQARSESTRHEQK